jgi:lipopolysaccharide biosynthesis protein
MKLKGYLYGCLFFLALACVYYIFNQSTSIEQFKNTKLLVLYVFHDYNDRVKHFIENCIFYDENVDFIVISNDKNNKFEVPDYVKILFRDNIGYDFGGWSDALLKNELYKNYDKFIFVNSSVIGPFLPCNFKGKWTDIYLNGLQNNVKLFGSTINTNEKPLTESHLQSYIFSMDKTTLEYLIDCEIFSMTNYAKTFQNAIWDKEVLMSRKIIENNWNIGSLLQYYDNVDFTFQTKKPEEYDIKFLDDVMYPSFRNSLWNEYELVFIKGNRVSIDFSSGYKC